MVQDLCYTSLNDVLDSWEALRRMTSYERLAGKLLFQRIFENCPKAKVLFGFPVDMDVHSPEILHSKRFLMHATYMIEMLDTALNMLGPDTELVTEMMCELGQKHVRYGVTPEMFPIMGEALIWTLQHTLTADQFNESVQESWITIYKALSDEMIRAQMNMKARSH